jgi:hypothetical protein
MKKLFILLASAAVVLTLALSVGCEKPDTEGDFSVEPVGDTIKQDTAGASVNFEFVLKNNTDDNLTLSLDLPKDLQELPTNRWWGSICDTLCYLLPHEVDVPAKGSRVPSVIPFATFCLTKWMCLPKDRTRDSTLPYKATP